MKGLFLAVVLVAIGAGSAFAVNRTLPTDDNGRPIPAGSYDPLKTVVVYITKSLNYTLPTDFYYLGYDFKCAASDTQVAWNNDGKTWPEVEGDYIKNAAMQSVTFSNSSTAAPGSKCTIRFYGGQK